jgi:hypothetical protein
VICDRTPPTQQLVKITLYSACDKLLTFSQSYMGKLTCRTGPFNCLWAAMRRDDGAWLRRGKIYEYCVERCDRV